MRITFITGFFMLAACVAAAPIPERRDVVDFYDPRKGGGRLLNFSAGLGEPLNVIISGKSSPEVLTKDGFLNYARAVGYSMECFGAHKGGKQQANLGDGHGNVDEREVLREHFGIPLLGTCLESLAGGNHLRTFRQDGPDANSGALFLAISQEDNVIDKHAIVTDGYNIGRDRFVNGALGKKRFLFKTYTTTVQDITELLPPGAEGVNHGITQDGVVKLLMVTAKFSLF